MQGRDELMGVPTTPEGGDRLSEHAWAAGDTRPAHFVVEVDARLRRYGSSRHGNKDNPLNELVYIILSAQTEAYSYQATYEALAQAFPNWAGLTSAAEDDVAFVIRRGGLARKKARQILGALRKIEQDFGRLSLDSLCDWGDDEGERYLTSLPGVGIKSAKCVLLYAFDRPVFPVDTHVWRVCRRLGLTPAVPKPTSAQQKSLEALIPPAARYTLHVNLVSHGQETCRTYWPKCEGCSLIDLCPSAFNPDQVWGAWRKPQGAWAKAIEDTEAPTDPRTPEIPPAPRGERGRRRPGGSKSGEGCR